MRHHGHHHGHPMSTTMGTLCAPRGHHHHAPSLRQTVPVHALRRALQSRSAPIRRSSLLFLDRHQSPGL